MSGRTILCRRRNEQVANERGTQRGLTPSWKAFPGVGRAQTRSIEAKAEALRRVGCYCRCPAKRWRIPLETNAIVRPSRGSLRTVLRRYVPKHTWRLVVVPIKARKLSVSTVTPLLRRRGDIALEGKHGPPRSHATWASPLRAARVRRHSASPDGLCCPPSHGVRSQSESPRQPAIASVGGSRFRW